MEKLNLSEHLLNCPKQDGKRCQCEYLNQILVVEYLDILKSQGKIVMFTAIPNSTWTPSWSQKRKNKKAGLNPGFPDMVIVTPTETFCIEMKAGKNKPTPEQKAWAVALSNTGISCYLAYGYDEAKDIIDRCILI